MQDDLRFASEPPRDRAFDMLGQLIDGVIAQACVRHYDAKTQEHQLTAKIAAAIEREVGNTTVDGYAVRVAVQDMPDKGRGSIERKTGADLYVSVVLESDDGYVISKGILIQTKWDDTLAPRTADTRRQLSDMLDRTSAAHVWVYSPSGATSIPAADVLRGDTKSASSTPGQLIVDGLKCKEGDVAIGRDTSKTLVRSLNEMLENLAVDSGLAVTVHSRTRRRKSTEQTSG